MSAPFFWIASYPKSGNTWLRLMLRSLAQGGGAIDLDTRGFAPIASRRDALDYWCDVQSSDLTEDEAMDLRPLLHREQAAAATETMLSKVHDAWGCTPSGAPLFAPDLTRGSVYLVRDPRDIALSFAHHGGKSVDDTIAFMARDDAALSPNKRGGLKQLRQRLSSWSGHVASWLSAEPRPLVLRYEDMIADPITALAEVAAHLGWAPGREALASAAAATRFSSLQAAEARDGFAERPMTAATFFRSGRIGEWRNRLTPAQAARIAADHGGIMRRLGYL